MNQLTQKIKKHLNTKEEDLMKLKGEKQFQAIFFELLILLCLLFAGAGLGFIIKSFL